MIDSSRVDTESVLELAKQVGLYYTPDEAWANKPADKRLKARLKNFAVAVLNNKDSILYEETTPKAKA